MKHSLALFVLIASSLAFGPVAVRAGEDVPKVAAASDLQFALSETAARFTEQTGKRVSLSFGSSGNFFRQIQEGAPFEGYLSADEQYVFDLAKKGWTLDEGVLYAEGRIAIIVPPGSPLKADGSFADLVANLDAGTVRKFAIANPDHAPYGRAARDALVRAGLWDRIRDQLVLGENVSQAAQFATSGSTDGGIIAYSLALAPKVSQLGEVALIAADQHDPLRQRMVLTRKAGQTAREFYAYLQSKAAQDVLKQYGFSVPEGK